MNLPRARTEAADTPATPGVVDVHRLYGDFVWASLQRMGVREADLEDVFQEVFVVVHQRLAGFEGRSKLTTWLFGICLKVAAAHRRRAYVRHESPSDDAALEVPHQGPDAEALREQAQAREELARLLDELDVEKRAVFVMTEIEEMAADEIAALTGVPVGTVYSRLHAARRQFEQAVARRNARAMRRERGAR